MPADHKGHFVFRQVLYKCCWFRLIYKYVSCLLWYIIKYIIFYFQEPPWHNWNIVEKHYQTNKHIFKISVHLYIYTNIMCDTTRKKKCNVYMCFMCKYIYNLSWLELCMFYTYILYLLFSRFLCIYIYKKACAYFMCDTSNL